MTHRDTEIDLPSLIWPALPEPAGAWATAQATLSRRRLRRQTAIAGVTVLAAGTVWTALPTRAPTDSLVPAAVPAVPAAPAVPSRESPELGRTALSEVVQRALVSAGLQPPASVDVLARLVVGGSTVWTYGYPGCTVTYTQGPGDVTGTFCLDAGAVAGDIETWPEPIMVAGPSSLDVGAARDEVLRGQAPPGTTTITLRTPGFPAMQEPAYDSGQAYGHVAYFLAPWPHRSTTALAARDATGRQVATIVLAATTARGAPSQ